MKKTISFTMIVFLFLAVFFTQAFAYGTSPTTLKPKKSPQPNETLTADSAADDQADQQEDKGQKPDKPNSHAGKKFHFQGEVISYSGGELVLVEKDGENVSVTLDADTVIKVAGAKAAAATNAAAAAIQVNDRVVVQAAASGDDGYLALRVNVIPQKPVHTHRVGEVTAYAPGVSITVEDKQGTTTFDLAPDAKILPADRADQLGVGSRVTIICPRDPSGSSLLAIGIVVHPEK
jgi:hypothetical protein